MARQVMQLYETNEWKLVDRTGNAVVHQDSENKPNWEMNQVNLLSDPSAVHHSTNSFIHLNW